MRIVGNLDVEVTWARMDAAARRARGEKAPSPDDPRFALPEPVLRKISAAATLLRVFANWDEDELWTPRPVDPARMPRYTWLPSPRLVSGPCPEAADLWWGQPTELAARLNHRSFVHELRRSLGIALDGERIVRDVAELEEGVRGLPAWVAKAPHSAAGRLRVRGKGALDPNSRRQAETLLALHGCLVVEPWVERRAEFGILGDATRDGAAWADPHRNLSDGGGRFLGIEFGRPAGADATRAMTGVAGAFGGAVHDAGHRGPFGIDFVEAAVCGDARARVFPTEMNVRRTFGQVAGKLLERAPDRWSDGGRGGVLRFGRGAPPPATLPLLLPGADDDTSAWLEAPSRHAG